jgi:type IV secretory pathway TraG/TraD family ATPase VirD4
MFKDTTRPIRELKTHRDYSLTLDCSVTSIKEELQDAVRLIINMIVYTFEAEPTKNGQCLMILDEFNACGYNSCIESSMPVLRSQGLSAVPAIQDLEGLQAAYPKTYLSFIGNSDATVWMSSSHPKNLGQLSSILGKKTLVEKDSFTGRKSYREVDVATPEQLGRFLSTETHHMIVTRAGKRALRLFLDPHYKALPVWQYSPDPDHKEALFRRLVRRLIGAFFNNKSD